MGASRPFFFCLLSLMILLVPLVAGQEPRPEYQASDILAWISEGKDVDIREAVIRGDLDFTTLPSDEVSGGPGRIVRITNKISITNSEITNLNAFDPDLLLIFESDISFEDTKFVQSSIFRKAQFLGSADFGFAQFSGDAGFWVAQFSGDAGFWGAQFLGRADFGGAQFSGRGSFQGAKFSYADFFQAHFAGDALFPGAEFEETRFVDTIFGGKANFGGTQFLRLGALFNRTSFLNIAEFTNAQFSGESSFEHTEFYAVVSYININAERLLFLNTRFYDRAIFNQAKFGELTFGFPQQSDANLSPDFKPLPSVFFERVDFRDSQFDVADFSSVYFEEVDFTDARFNNRLDLSNTIYRQLTIDNLNFSKLKPTNVDILARLEKNFRDSGQLELANEAFYQRMVIAREEKPQEIMVTELIFLDWPFGYGVRPVNALSVSIVLILVFAVFYYPSGIVGRRKRKEGQRFSLRLRDIPISGEEDAAYHPGKIRRVWDASMFSFSMYTKLGTGMRFAKRLRSIVIIEWIVGLIMIGGLLYTLTNTIPALQQLLAFLL